MRRRIKLYILAMPVIIACVLFSVITYWGIALLGRVMWYEDIRPVIISEVVVLTLALPVVVMLAYDLVKIVRRR